MAATERVTSMEVSPELNEHVYMVLYTDFLIDFCCMPLSVVLKDFFFLYFV